MLNVSARLVRAAKAVQARATPELARAVEQGKLAVSAAAQAVDLDADVQRRIAEDAAAGRVNAVRLVIKQLRRDEREKSRGARLMALPQKSLRRRARRF